MLVKRFGSTLVSIYISGQYYDTLRQGSSKAQSPNLPSLLRCFHLTLTKNGLTTLQGLPPKQLDQSKAKQATRTQPLSYNVSNLFGKDLIEYPRVVLVMCKTMVQQSSFTIYTIGESHRGLACSNWTPLFTISKSALQPAEQSSPIK